jgi:hypothetical protein
MRSNRVKWLMAYIISSSLINVCSAAGTDIDKRQSDYRLINVLLCPSPLKKISAIAHVTRSGNSPMLSNYTASVSTPVSTCCLGSKFSSSQFSGNCHIGIGECQLSGQSNPASGLPITKGNWSRISLPNWFSNCDATMF